MGDTQGSITNVQNMQSAVSATETAIEGLRRAIVEVNTHVNDTQAGWSSQGARFFRQVMTEFGDKYQDMINDLVAIHGALTGNTNHYRAAIVAEQENANRFSNLLSVQI